MCKMSTCTLITMLGLYVLLIDVLQELRNKNSQLKQELVSIKSVHNYKSAIALAVHVRVCG